MASANPDAPAADDADGDDASATFSFDDDEDAALAAVVDDLAMEPDEHRVPSLIAEAVLRNAGGAPDEALACAAAAVRTHDLCGAADERFRFACHDRRLGVQMMAVFLRVKAPASSARWELLARVKSGAACAAAEASSTGALIVLAPRKYDEAASLRGCAAGELRVVVDGDAHAEVRALKVSGARVSLDRILVTGGAAVAETAGAVTFRRCILSNGNGAALETRGADVALESSVVEHARDGVLVHGGGFRLSGSTVQYCYCDGVSAHVRVVVEDVVIKDCGGRGLTSTVRFDPFVRRGANDIQADPEFDEADGQRAAAARAAADPAALRQRERHAARRDDDDDDAAAGELPGVLPEPQVPRL
ncbi:hypothetical protein JL721_2870 [Aureococcus anophagefferens]|nr:hypothetical protein JL721_2870 [Aureococcus anophagefferens]